MENVLFKISFPAAFHAQTLAEAALRLHQEVSGGLEKTGGEHNHPGAWRSPRPSLSTNPQIGGHCLQHMVTIALIYGELTANHYE